MAPSFSDEDSQLIASLHALSKKSPKLVKSSTYPAPADPQTIVRSWKMNEFKYYDIPSPFPTLARGIFTVELSPSGKLEGAAVEKDETAGTSAVEEKYRIVARGYDKFFNIGEVPWCTVRRFKPETINLSNGSNSGPHSKLTQQHPTRSLSNPTDASSFSPHSHQPSF